MQIKYILHLLKSDTLKACEADKIELSFPACIFHALRMTSSLKFIS